MDTRTRVVVKMRPLNTGSRFCSSAFRLLSIVLRVVIVALAAPALARGEQALPTRSGVHPFRASACTPASIACNTQVPGNLTTDDCQVDSIDRSLYDAWTFQATAGQSVQITLQSAAFDAYLWLYGPSDLPGNPVAENDNYAGGGTNSRISFSVTESGTHTIWANTSDFEPVTGAYSLELECSGSQPAKPSTQ